MLKTKGAVRLKTMTAHVTAEDWRAVKMLAAKTDRTLHSLVTEGVIDVLSKYARRASAE